MIVLVAMLAAVTGCSGSYYVTNRPDDVVYARPGAPGAGYVWIDGDWVWGGGSYVWHEGHWDHPRAGRSWHGGNWESTSRGWRWHRGGWR
jgi:hypothetical protein